MALTSSTLNPHRLTSLQRVVDPRYPSNRLALAGAAVAGAVAAVARFAGADIGFGPLGAAMAVFLAWAIARELDPDHPASAAFAMPAGFVLLLAAGEASLLVSAAVLLAARITAGTVGTDLRPLDVLALIGLSGLLGSQSIGVVGLALIVAAVFITDHSEVRSAGITVAVIAAFATVAIASGSGLTWGTPDAADWATLAVSVIALVLIIPASPVASQTDRGSGTIDSNRVTTARLMAALAVVGAFLVAGGIGIHAIAPTTTAALIGTAAQRLRIRPPLTMLHIQ
jgi:hypothetical protein